MLTELVKVRKNSMLSILPNQIRSGYFWGCMDRPSSILNK
jgi:hypothetical protein